MIQAISSANVQSNKAVSSQPLKPNFGHTPGYYDAPPYKPKRRSALGWAVQQFATGAAVSVIWDGVANLFNKMAKKPPSVKGFNQFAQRAGFLGVVFVAANLVFEGIAALSKKSK